MKTQSTKNQTVKGQMKNVKVTNSIVEKKVKPIEMPNFKRVSQFESFDMTKYSKGRILSKLFDAYGQKIFNRYNFLIRNYNVSKELQADAFSRFWVGFSNPEFELKTGKDVRNYLYTTANAVLTDYFRNRNAKKNILTLLESETISNDENDNNTSIDMYSLKNSQADFKLLKTEFKNSVEKVLSRVKNSDSKDIFRLYLDGLKYKEIAKELNITIEKVKVSINRVRKEFNKSTWVQAIKLKYSQKKLNELSNCESNFYDITNEYVYEYFYNNTHKNMFECEQ